MTRLIAICRIAGQALAASLLLHACAASPAYAHGEFDWIMNDPNPAISSCCGPADCEHVAAGKIEATGAGWYLHETGEVIPFDKTFPSKDGQVARCRYLATGKTRCLFIPPGGS